jgi:hypothetical protein
MKKHPTYTIEVHENIDGGGILGNVRSVDSYTGEVRTHYTTEPKHDREEAETTAYAWMTARLRQDDEVDRQRGELGAELATRLGEVRAVVRSLEENRKDLSEKIKATAVEMWRLVEEADVDNDLATVLPGALIELHRQEHVLVEQRVEVAKQIKEQGARVWTLVDEANNPQVAMVFEKPAERCVERVKDTDDEGPNTTSAGKRKAKKPPKRPLGLGLDPEAARKAYEEAGQ